MPTILQFRRGTTAQNGNYAGSNGEITVDTDKKTIVVHDGATAGGSPMVTETSTQTLTNKTLTSPTLTSPNLTTPTIGGTAIDEYIADTIGAMVSGNTESGIAVTYDDTDNTLDFDVGDFTITLAGDLSGSATVTNLASATLTATIVANSVDLGTDTTGNYVASGATSGNGISGSVSSEGGTFTVTSNATSANTANTIVYRDASGDFSAGVMTATSTSARYADLAERYQADAQYAPGTVLVFGGDQEVTVSTKSHDPAVAGIVSTDPAYLMNSALTGTNTVAIALTGRVPCMVKGPVAKGSVLVTGEDAGVAQAIDYNKFFPGVVLGKSMGVVAEGETNLIEVAVGRF